MKIGIIGSGNVGKSLAECFLSIGYEVKLASRSPEKLNDWLLEKGDNISVGSFAEAAKFGELIVLAVPWNAVENALRLAGKENLREKILIDVTNFFEIRGKIPIYLGSPQKSFGEKIQKILPHTKVVKAFNYVANSIMCNPKREEGEPDLFLAGDDEAKEVVFSLATKWGWKNLVDFGDIHQSYLLETIAVAYMNYAFKNNSWDIAFKLLKK